MAYQTKIGIIGGTGMGDPDLLENPIKKPVTTQFGDPSGGVIIEGTIGGVPCVAIARHGSKHNINPSNVNYRANITALKEAGCTHIISSTATGSLRDEIAPGDFVIIDDFIDRTQNRKQTFYSGDEGSLPGVMHLPVHPPFSEPLRQVVCQTMEQLQLKHHKNGTVVTIEGPRFSSRSESRTYQLYGAALVNMSTVPEVVLAKEAGILYATIAIVTDYDCWKDNIESVTHQAVTEVFKKNIDKTKQLIREVVKNIAAKNWDREILDLQRLVGLSNEPADRPHRECKCEPIKQQK